MARKFGAAITLGGAMLLLTGLGAARAQDGPRFPPVTMEQLNPEQQVVAAEALKQSSAGLGGPYAMLIKSPELLKRYLMMTEYYSAPEDIAAAPVERNGDPAGGADMGCAI